MEGTYVRNLLQISNVRSSVRRRIGFIRGCETAAAVLTFKSWRNYHKTYAHNAVNY